MGFVQNIKISMSLKLNEIADLAGTSLRNVKVALRRRRLMDQGLNSVVKWIQLEQETRIQRGFRRFMLIEGWTPPKRPVRERIFSKWFDRQNRYI